MNYKRRSINSISIKFQAIQLLKFDNIKVMFVIYERQKKKENEKRKRSKRSG